MMYKINVNEYALHESYNFIKGLLECEESVDVIFVKNSDVTLFEHRFTRNDDVFEFVNTVYSSLFEKQEKQEKQEKRYKHGDIECIDAIRACMSKEEFRGFCKGNVIKYLWRAEYKGGEKDYKKASDYLNYMMEAE